jgi:hypothetical protein
MRLPSEFWVELCPYPFLNQSITEAIPIELLPAGRVAIPEGLPSKEKSLTINPINIVNKALIREGGCLLCNSLIESNGI